MRNIDMTDSFKLIRLLDSLNIKETLANEIVALYEGRKTVKDGAVPVQDGAEQAMPILLCLISAFAQKGAEEAFYEFISGPLEMPVGDIKRLPPQECLSLIAQIASAEEWKSFFTFVSRLRKRG